MLLCWDGLESQTSSYRFVEWSVCESCKSEEFSEFLLFLGEIEMFEPNLVRKENESCFISTDM